MTWQMYGGEAVPNGNLCVIVQPTIGLERRIGENSTADSFEQSTDSCGAPIRETAFVVRRIEPRCSYPCPRIFRERGDIENVVEMSMSHDDSSNGFVIPASSAQGAGKEIASSDEACIDQIESVRVAKHIKAQRRRADLKYVIVHESLASNESLHGE